MPIKLHPQHLSTQVFTLLARERGEESERLQQLYLRFSDASVYQPPQ